MNIRFHGIDFCCEKYDLTRIGTVLLCNVVNSQSTKCAFITILFHSSHVRFVF